MRVRGEEKRGEKRRGEENRIFEDREKIKTWRK